MGMMSDEAIKHRDEVVEEKEDVTFDMHKKVNQNEKDRIDSLYRLQDKRREELKNKINKARYVLHVAFLVETVLIAIVLCILMLIYRFSHPELTETQLFIYFFQKYWWMFASVAVGLVASNAFE